jgi:RNA polymerase sigma-70 factor, ECF subfamily
LPAPDALDKTFSLSSGQGDNKAAKEAESCFLLYSRSLQRYALTLMTDADAAAELVQETFYRFFTQLRDGHAVTNYRAWLASTCRNLAVDEWRRRRHVEPLDLEQDTFCAPEPGIEADMLDRERLEHLEHLLHVLPEFSRRCIELRMQGLRLREIGDRVGACPSAVAADLVRSAKRLRRLQSLTR